MIYYSDQKKLIEVLNTLNLKQDIKDGSFKSQLVELAKYFLYGGYFELTNNGSNPVHRKIYIKEIEFYYYDEEDSTCIENDVKMYHRNNNLKYYGSKFPNNDNELLPIGNKVHYLNPGSFYSHLSGVDITFENKEHKYRASGLIRAFSVEQDGIMLKLNKENDTTDTRSTIIYEYLMENYSPFDDFSQKLIWIDAYTDAPEKLIPTSRVNLDGKERRFKKKQ